MYCSSVRAVASGKTYLDVTCCPRSVLRCIYIIQVDVQEVSDQGALGLIYLDSGGFFKFARILCRADMLPDASGIRSLMHGISF